MASFMLFKVNANLFNSNGESPELLNLTDILQRMQEALLTVNPQNQAVSSSGFSNPRIEHFTPPVITFSEIDSANLANGQPEEDLEETLYELKIEDGTPDSNIQMISSSVTGRGSLGYYQKAYLNAQGRIFSENVQQEFYTNANVNILENGIVLIFFEKTSSEKIKGDIISLLDNQLNLELEPVRMSSELLRLVRQHTNWQNIKLDKIKNVDDRTKSVHYEVDLSNQTDPAVIHDLYKDKGKMVQLTSAIPYTPENETLQTGAFRINLYQVGHRLSVIDAQFNDNLKEMQRFALNFAFILKEIYDKNN